ncbi:hypothetical protein ACWCO9_31470 [Streptomyces sp. NPDC001937]
MKTVAVAEANSNSLPGRTLALPGDPLIAAAEQSIRDAGAEPGTEPVSAPAPEPVATEPPAPEPLAAETEAETTMQFRLPTVPEVRPAPAASDPYAIGPDRHERTADESQEPFAAPVPAVTTVAEAFPGPRQPEPQQQQPQGERITDKGLPKRTPKVVKPAAAPATERKGSLDKEALRRRLGGFHQGAKNGRRDVEAEIAEGAGSAVGAGPALGVDRSERTAQTDHTELADRPGGRTDDTGDTVEEARS